MVRNVEGGIHSYTFPVLMEKADGRARCTRCRVQEEKEDLSAPGRAVWEGRVWWQKSERIWVMCR